MKNVENSNYLLSTRSVILLVGEPGVGKTTIIKKIIDKKEYQFSGFYTKEILLGDHRVGFRIVSLDGATDILATKNLDVIFPRDVQFGNYKVNLDAIDNVAVRSLKRKISIDTIIIVDEIGPMEILSDLFCSAVMEILNKSSNTILGTISQRKYEFTKIVKRHHRVKLLDVTAENRDIIPKKIESLLT